jgi:hypothetical protein
LTTARFVSVLSGELVSVMGATESRDNSLAARMLRALKD